MDNSEWRRRLPVGAEVLPDGGVHFRVWAPGHNRIEVVIENPGGRESGGSPSAFGLEAESSGYFSGLVKEAFDGALYRFRIDGGDKLFPDPASRFQPEGPHGPSEVVDPHGFKWSDESWRGAQIRGQIIYEMHVGTFTPEGTWQAASREIEELARAGITMIEMMPVAEFPGRFGWGYDGVDLFAPTRLYGRPDDLRRFIDRAHASGCAVILDVVYNHLGPDGNYLKQFSEDYFSSRHKTEWGEALNFDGENAAAVREFFTANAAYWIKEFHFDGLRLDATQSVFDDSPAHILGEITRHARQAAGDRSVLIIAENEPQQTKLVRPPDQGGYGMDGLWNDDFHHSAMVALTGRNEAYYSDHLGKPQEFISAIKWGYLYQGQRYRWQQKRRGTPAFGLDPAAFVTFIQNHDQVANSARGWRAHLLTSPARYRAMTALMLLAPGTPMLFQGQEFAASSPFLYFADHEGDLGRAVCEGRTEFLTQFPSVDTPQMKPLLIDPCSERAFTLSKLDLSERESHAETYLMHRDLMRLRREDPTFSAQRAGAVDGAVLADEAFVLRFFSEGRDDRLLIVNFGRDIMLDPAPEPLLAPPEEMVWEILWSSEDPRYGGNGTPPLDTDEGWKIPGHSAVAMMPKRMEESRDE